MKIKCPFDPFESAPDYTKGGLSLHLQEDHEVREVIADYFANMIFKIHEMIDQIENTRMAQNGSLYQFQVAGLAILKSLVKDKN